MSLNLGCGDGGAFFSLLSVACEGSISRARFSVCGAGVVVGFCASSVEIVVRNG